jgi:hypothetical protein
MANRAGLKKVTKTVKGQKGTVRRSYWVKASQAAKKGRPVAQQKQPGFLRRNAGKIVGGLALAAGLALAHHKYKSIQPPKTTPKHWKHVVDRHGGFWKNLHNKAVSQHANSNADWKRQDLHNSGRAPLQLGPGVSSGRSGTGPSKSGKIVATRKPRKRK